MRVKAWITIEREVEVDVSFEDFLSSIAETAQDDCVTRLLSSIAHHLKAVDKQAIDRMTHEQREITVRFLLDQAQRYEP